MTARHFIVTGYVQGVGFRWFVMRRARSLGLTGWVRNLPDGSVEAWAEGDEEALTNLESLLRLGPSSSTVKFVETREARATGSFIGFDISH
jgi:acylphosphatase